MEFAPALSSIITPAYITTFVIENYGFDKSTTCNLLRSGINHTYLITTPDKKFVFRVYHINWRTENEINEELKLLDYLKENNQLVSYPIKDTSNKYIQQINTIEGNRFGILFSYAEGEVIRKPSEKVCFNFGIAMAKLHQLTVDKQIDRKTHNANSLVKWALEKVVYKFPDSVNEIDYFKRAYQVISSKFEHTVNVRKGIVHLDLWHDNMKVKNKTEITFFDFDNCGNGFLFLDIGYSLMLFYRNDPHKERFLARQASFLKGYESIVKISDEEKRLIPYGGLAIWLHYTGQHVQRFNDFSNHFLSDEFLKYWISTVNKWMLFNNISLLKNKSS